MDQTFDFRADRPPLHRRVSPRATALAVSAAVLLSGLVAFSWWVTDSERRSLERAEGAGQAISAVGTIPGRESDLVTQPGVAIDEAARSDALSALDAARRIASGSGSFLDAGPWQLGAAASALIFVDGPALGPGVVSVASTRRAWGAAVMGSSGTCYLLRYSSGGIGYGIGRVCTGAEALEADDTTW